MSGHLGVFPSYYEPWGYTPLEAGALGVSSVTTDLAGFGTFVQNAKQNPDSPGIYVLKRVNKTDEAIVADLSEFMHWFAKLGKHERVQNKLEAKRIASLADWKILVQNYIKAHEMAAQKVF